MLGRIKHALERVLFASDWLPILKRAPRRDAITLTFDDGPSPATTLELLELLRIHGATATFFLCGARVARYPALVEAIVAGGHSVFAHGFDHVRMDALTPDQFVDNLDRTEALLSRFRPTPYPYAVRLPYGSGHHSLKIHRQLQAWRPGCVVAHWAYSLEDFRLADQCETEAELRERCALAVKDAFASPHFAGSIVLMHEDPLDVEAPLSPRVAPILLRKMLAQARLQGLVAVGLCIPRINIVAPMANRVAVG